MKKNIVVLKCQSPLVMMVFYEAKTLVVASRQRLGSDSALSQVVVALNNWFVDENATFLNFSFQHLEDHHLIIPRNYDMGNRKINTTIVLL